MTAEGAQSRRLTSIACPNRDLVTLTSITHVCGARVSQRQDRPGRAHYAFRLRVHLGKEDLDEVSIETLIEAHLSAVRHLVSNGCLKSQKRMPRPPCPAQAAGRWQASRRAALMQRRHSAERDQLRARRSLSRSMACPEQHFAMFSSQIDENNQAGKFVVLQMVSGNRSLWRISSRQSSHKACRPW